MSDGAHDHHTSHESADTNATSGHGTSPKRNLRHRASEMHALLVAKLTRSHAAMPKRWPALPEATLDNAAELYERFRDADGCSRSLHDEVARAQRRRFRVVIAGCNWWTDRADEAARKLITIGASLGLDVTPLIQYVADVHHISTILYCTCKPQKPQDMCSAAIRTASLVSVTAASQTPDRARVSRPDPVAVAVVMKSNDPNLSVRKAANAVGMHYSTLAKHPLWKAAVDRLKQVGRGRMRPGSKSKEGIIEAADE